MKLALLLLVATLPGCVIREKVRIEYKTLPPTEKVYFIVPESSAKPEGPSRDQQRIERNKEAQDYA